MESNGLSCQHCGERFQRREHRDRHILRHTGLKPFQCDFCSKSFARNDTLLRHRALHDSRSGLSRSRGRRSRGQACVSCSRLKQSCSGGNPCSRCEVRDTECIYNHTKSSGAPYLENDQDGSLPSPLMARGTDIVNEDIMSGEICTISEEWNNSLSMPPDSTIASSTIYTTVHDTTPSDWQHVSSLGTMTSGPWTPWDPLMLSSSLPWFMDELEIPMDFPDLPDPVDPPQTVDQSATSTISFQKTGPAPTEPQLLATGNSACPQSYLSPEKICSSYTRPCLPLPKAQDVCLQTAGAEIFGHIYNIPRQAVEGLNDFHRTQRRDMIISAIPQNILHAFIELYFEYFNSQFPFLHPSRLEDPDLPWILLLATAAVGSHYSEIQGAEEYHHALCDLLARAVEQEVSNHLLKVDIATVQSVFLLHVLWMFSSSYKEKVMLQHKRSSLCTLCWDLLGRANKRRQVCQPDLDTEEAWQAWLTNESEVRLITCVRVLECLGHILLFMPLVTSLRDATRRLPCPEKLWKSRNALDWKSNLETLADPQPGVRRESSSQEQSGGPSTPDSFSSKVALLELYLDEKSVSSQLLTSELLRSSFASYLGSESGTGAGPNPHKLETRSENNLLDITIDRLASMNMVTAEDTMVHVIAILRLIPIPLEALHSATGWETNKEQMVESKMRLRDFFQNNGTKARKGLWHATCIFKITRSSRRLMCYDALSLASAMGYIYSYSETLAQTSPHPSSSIRPVIVRLDQLHERSVVEQWIKNGAESVVHLTGVGLLDGSDHSVRLLRDIEKTLASQIAWRGFCRILAACFARLRRGEVPMSRDDKKDE